MDDLMIDVSMPSVRLREEPSVHLLEEHRHAYEVGHPRRESVPIRLKLSVAMAAHNEERTIHRAVSEVLAVNGAFDLELIVVDDGSTDRTADVVRSFDDPRLTLLSHGHCRGKGAAVLTAAAAATGSYLLIFDADLEYSARDIPALMQPVLEGLGTVVYGARVPGMGTAFQSSRYKLGSDLTTLFTNVVFDAWLQDMHTCLKLMPLGLLRELSLSQNGFGLDTEITGELLRRGIRPYEVPCSYRGRSHAAGKKISPRDGLECLKIVLEVRFRGVLSYDPVMIGNESGEAADAPLVQDWVAKAPAAKVSRLTRGNALRSNRVASSAFHARGQLRLARSGRLVLSGDSSTAS